LGDGLCLFCIFNGKSMNYLIALFYKTDLISLFVTFYAQCPGLGFFYAGLARAKNALSLMYLCLLSVGVVSIQVKKQNKTKKTLTMIIL
jgi:hypothetical protein